MSAPPGRIYFPVGHLFCNYAAPGQTRPLRGAEPPNRACAPRAANDQSIVYFSQIIEVGHPAYLTIAAERDPLVAALRTLANYGAAAGRGEHFILHLGI